MKSQKAHTMPAPRRARTPSAGTSANISSANIAKAREILEGASTPYGSSGRLEDSEVYDKTSKLYKEELNKHTVMTPLDSSTSYSSNQLALLRKQRALQERLKAYNKQTPFSRDTDHYLMTKDVPDFKNEVVQSRNSAHAAMDPFFTEVARNGRRTVGESQYFMRAHSTI